MRLKANSSQTKQRGGSAGTAGWSLDGPPSSIDHPVKVHNANTVCGREDCTCWHTRQSRKITEHTDWRGHIPDRQSVGRAIMDSGFGVGLTETHSRACGSLTSVQARTICMERYSFHKCLSSNLQSPFSFKLYSLVSTSCFPCCYSRNQCSLSPHLLSSASRVLRIGAFPPKGPLPIASFSSVLADQHLQ